MGKKIYKMKTIITIIIFLWIIQNSFAQDKKIDRIPVFSDAIIKDSYMKSVDLKRNHIDSLIYYYKDHIRKDTIPFKISYKIKNEDSKYIIQNEASVDYIEQLFENYKKINPDSSSVIITTYKNRILEIETQSLLPVNPFPFTYNLYFDKNKLIFSEHGCSYPFESMGLCNGTTSEYFNYFKSGKYYTTIIQEHKLGSSCGCGLNFIINNTVIKKLTEIALSKLSAN